MTTRTVPPKVEIPSFEKVYAEVQQFYAWQMQLLDSGAAEEWARTFTEDGSFAPPSLPEPVRGRKNLAAGVRRTTAELAESGEVRRHFLGMLDVRPQADGSLWVRSYAQIIGTLGKAVPCLQLMCVCEDVLVREDGELRVSRRVVSRDDAPEPWR